MSRATAEPPASSATPGSQTGEVASSSPLLSEVVAAGNTLKSLEAMRDQIASDLDACNSMRDKASLYLRLADVIKSIDEVRPAETKGDAVDEIAARRSSRRSSTPEGASRSAR